MLQVNYAYGNTAHLPYTACTLLAYAMNDTKISSIYEIKDVFFLREKPDAIVEKIENPSFIGFSSYIWNYEFNKCVAEKIKAKYPECVIVFGGHHVTPDASLLRECRFVDYLIHGEGEETLRRLLLAVQGLDDAGSIPGISMRKGDEILTNPSVISNDEYIDYPSPYLNGFFDKILEEHKDMDFMAMIETTRGCPNCCAYCDWSNMKSRIRKFPMEKVKEEIRWISEHHILGLGSADSNFGCFERDEEIVDYLIGMNLINGFPTKFQTSYAKDSDERVFRIGQALEKCRLSKGITLSFQSMDDTVLNNIGRHNIPISHYSHLMDMYNNAGIPTYTELILGLPGETYDSFANGIDSLLNSGQHNAIYVHNCEWLPNSVMGRKGYIEKHHISTSVIPLNEPHIECDDDGVKEYSRLITSTSSMTNDDWIRMNLFSIVVQAFHNMGLLQFFAVYLHYEKGLSYRSFYEALTARLLDDAGAVPALSHIKTILKSICLGKKDTPFVLTHPDFGNVKWTFEEYVFLSTVNDLDKFYADIRPFLESFFEDKVLFDELFDFQKIMMKSPFSGKGDFEFSFNFVPYFRNHLRNKAVNMEKVRSRVLVPGITFPDKVRYAKNVVWYGRKDNTNTFIFECEYKVVR